MTPEILHLLRWTELTSVLFMTGLIWFVQVVHYPLLAKVGADSIGYQASHMTRTTWGGRAADARRGRLLRRLGAARRRPGGWQRWPSTALLAVVWGATAFLLVPAHDALARGFDPAVHERLVAANWIRTVAWTARAALCVAAMMRAPA